MVNMDSFTFADFPQDIQFTILSFLCPKDIAIFSSTSKRFAPLSSDEKLWYAMCERRWGGKTQIEKWGAGKISFKLLYETLDQWSNLIGFWRRSGLLNNSPAILIKFDWGPSFVAGTGLRHLYNCDCDCDGDDREYPFVWMSLSPDGEIVSFLQLKAEIKKWDDFDRCCQLGNVEDFVSVNVNLMDVKHVVIEENYGGQSSPGSSSVGESSEECLVTEMYTQLANKKSPGGGGERAWRRQRKREEKRKRRWESQHFVKTPEFMTQHHLD